VELSQRARVRAGDHDEFGVLFSEHARAVYNHAFRLTGNWSAAEEVVSLTFLEAWRLRGTVRPEGGSLLPWLLGIALNVARNVSRAARRQQAAMTRLPKAQDVPDFADDLAGRLDDAERLEKIHAALPGLRRAERDVLALCVPRPRRRSGCRWARSAPACPGPGGSCSGNCHGNPDRRANR
jgi:RNA polymerase sigma-70 factor (ECF subfamily)